MSKKNLDESILKFSTCSVLNMLGAESSNIYERTWNKNFRFLHCQRPNARILNRTRSI